MALSRLKPLQRHHNPLEAPLSSPVAVDRIETNLPVGACVDVVRPRCLDAQQAPTEPKPDFAVAAAETRSSEVLRCDFVAIRNLAVTVVLEVRSQRSQIARWAASQSLIPCNPTATPGAQRKQQWLLQAASAKTPCLVPTS